MNDIPYIDEIHNSDLLSCTEFFHASMLRAELIRIDNLIKQRCLTGDDLSYWFDRKRCIRGLLNAL